MPWKKYRHGNNKEQISFIVPHERKVKPEIKKNIVSIIVPEFKGIDNLSTDIEKLKEVQYKL